MSCGTCRPMRGLPGFCITAICECACHAVLWALRQSETFAASSPAGRSALSPSLVGDVERLKRERDEAETRLETVERTGWQAVVERDAWRADAELWNDLFNALRYRLATIVDESCGMQPVMGADDLMTLLERHLFELRRSLAEQMALAGTVDPAGALESARDEVKALQRAVRDATIRAMAAEQNADCVEAIGWLAIVERNEAQASAEGAHGDRESVIWALFELHGTPIAGCAE